MPKPVKTPLELNEPTLIEPNQLRLDSQNPRLILSSRKTPGEDTIIQQLHLEDELDELLSSIAANGYLDFEPLVVLDEDPSAPYTVLEGNRRLAAIRLLTDRERAETLGINVPEMDKLLRTTMEKVRVIRVESRAEARTFIAFKHINGPHRWNSYAKAQYAARWFKETRDDNPDATLDAIADRIGDKHATIKRMVAAILVLEQADRNGIFTVDDRSTKRFPFSHLYTALSRKEYMSYLGIDDSWSAWVPTEDPIPQNRLTRLEEVLHWIFGYKPDGLDSIISSQNPDIKRLGEVLTSTVAIATLNDRRDLEIAWEQTRPADTRFSSALITARRAINDAVSSVHAFDGADRGLLDVASEIKEQADLLHDRMRKKSEAKG
ncbi:ParB N-terminal domain-containing protein [Hyphomonas sp.]|uniref:ParB N-terminal domain-containing protein n=1 Tax=Hyphomonas sp. TaxID=87 RepID=UPI003529387D